MTRRPTGPALGRRLLLSILGAGLIAGTIGPAGWAVAAKPENVVATDFSTVQSSVRGDSLIILIAVGRGAKVNGDFGISVEPGEGDSTIWAIPLPYTVVAPTPYFEGPVAIELPIAARRGTTSVRIEYGVCVDEGACIPQTVALSF